MVPTVLSTTPKSSITPSPSRPNALKSSSTPHINFVSNASASFIHHRRFLPMLFPSFVFQIYLNIKLFLPLHSIQHLLLIVQPNQDSNRNLCIFQSGLDHSFQLLYRQQLTRRLMCSKSFQFHRNILHIQLMCTITRAVRGEHGFVKLMK